MSKYKLYLGDSVYMSTDGFHIVLTTENGYGPSNTIFLEPDMIDRIKEYVCWLRNHGQEEVGNE